MRVKCWTKQQEKNKISVGDPFYSQEYFQWEFLAFMIAVLEQQVRENYEEALANPRVDKSNHDVETIDF